MFIESFKNLYSSSSTMQRYYNVCNNYDTSHRVLLIMNLTRFLLFKYIYYAVSIYFGDLPR